MVSLLHPRLGATPMKRSKLMGINKTVIVATVAILGSMSAANALTLKPGEVLTRSGEVIHASESPNTLAQIEQKGYAIVAGELHISVEEHVVSVDLDDLRGKSRAALKEVVKEEAISQISEVTGIEGAINSLDQLEGLSPDELQEKLENGVVDGLSHEQIQEAIDQADYALANEELGNGIGDLLEQLDNGELELDDNGQYWTTDANGGEVCLGNC